VIRSVHIPKTPEGELTWPQRLLTLGKAPYLADPIPDETIIDM